MKKKNLRSQRNLYLFRGVARDLRDVVRQFRAPIRRCTGDGPRSYIYVIGRVVDPSATSITSLDHPESASPHVAGDVALRLRLEELCQ